MDRQVNLIDEFLRAGKKRRCDLWLMSPDLRVMVDRSRGEPAGPLLNEQAMFRLLPGRRRNGNGRFHAALRKVTACMNILLGYMAIH